MKKIILVVFLVIAGAGFYWLVMREPADGAKNGEEILTEIVESSTDNSKTAETVAGTNAIESEAGTVVAESDDEEQTEEERQAAAEERLVDEFDAETDRWMDAEQTKPPTMKEVDAFRAKFKALPKDRKEECLHRALNLVPDENVMLLVGILMDKAEDKELVELIYNDILNREEDVKKPILETIFKDKSHPCWADTAWILDVTGEVPQSKSEE